jgi:hypothetical protein
LQSIDNGGSERYRIQTRLKCGPVKVFSVILVGLLQEIFRCMDTDGSGTVSLKELIEFLRAVSGDVDAREVMYPPTNQTSSFLSHLRALSRDVDAREVMYPPINLTASFLSYLRAFSGDVDAREVVYPPTNRTSSFLSHLRALSGDVDARDVMYYPTN